MATDRSRPGKSASRIRAPGQGGFTLIEMAITVAIVGILASSALPLAEMAQRRLKEADLRLALRQIRTAIDDYHEAAVGGRVAKSVDASGYPKRLEDLAAGITDAKDAQGRKIYFLRRLPRDPFHPDPSASAAETWGKRSYASPPDAPMAGADVFDVYSLSADKGMNGIAYRDW